MWWEGPLVAGSQPLYSDGRLTEAVARAFAVVEVGGLRGLGPERGRSFEQLFYAMCERRGLQLAERAGARTVAGQRSASRLAHEVDGATHTCTCISHWELKHLSGDVPKNELLVFNGKGLDFLQGSNALVAQTPTFRFLLSGGAVRNECRTFAVLWGITIIEPNRLPLPLICEAVARGVTDGLAPADVEVIQDRGAWACREVQVVLKELAAWTTATSEARRFGAVSATLASEVLDIQEQLGSVILDALDERYPDWLDDLANDTWNIVGGW
jgi:hypothetical protein